MFGSIAARVSSPALPRAAVSLSRAAGGSLLWRSPAATGVLSAMPVRCTSSKPNKPSWQRKKERKAKWKKIRAALDIAERASPQLLAEKKMWQTINDLGWPMLRNEQIGEGLSVQFSIPHQLAAIEVAPDAYYPGTWELRPEWEERKAAIERRGFVYVLLKREEWDAFYSPGPAGRRPERMNWLIKRVMRHAPFRTRPGADPADYQPQ